MSLSKIFNFRLSKKIPLIMIVFAFLTAMGVAYTIYSSAKVDLASQYRNNLFSLMKNKSSELTALFKFARVRHEIFICCTSN